MNILNIKEGQHYIAKIESHSFVDGEGVRCSVYVSGCPFQCKGCYNVQAQNFKYGEPFELEMLEEIFRLLCAFLYRRLKHTWWRTIL